MRDQATGADNAGVQMYSDEQVAFSRDLLGREPEGADLQAHHAEPADGVVLPEDDSTCPHCGQPMPTGGAS